MFQSALDFETVMRKLDFPGPSKFFNGSLKHLNIFGRMGIVDSLAKEFLPGLDQLAFIRSMNVQVIAIEIHAKNDIGMGFEENTVAVF